MEQNPTRDEFRKAMCEPACKQIVHNLRVINSMCNDDKEWTEVRKWLDNVQLFNSGEE